MGMDVLACQHAFRKELRTIQLAGETVEILPGRVRTLGEDWAMVTADDLAESEKEAVIDQEIQAFKSKGVDFEWKVFSWDHPELAMQLRSKGFQQGDEEVIMVFDLALGIHALGESRNIQTLMVTNDSSLSQFAEVEGKLKMRSQVGTLRAALESGSQDLLGFIALLEGDPIASARLYTHSESQFAGCYGGATLPEFRGRGAYRTLVIARAKEAILKGARYLLVDALPTSRPILERMGFDAIGSTWPFEWASQK